MTGAWVRVQRNGRWTEVELENLTENELNRLEVTRPEMGWQWTRFLVRFLRENVMEMNTTREVNEVSGTSNN